MRVRRRRRGFARRRGRRRGVRPRRRRTPRRGPGRPRAGGSGPGRASSVLVALASSRARRELGCEPFVRLGTAVFASLGGGRSESIQIRRRRSSVRSRIRKSPLIGQGSRRQSSRRRSRAAPNGCLARRTHKNLSLPWPETTMGGGSSSAARAAIAGTMGIRAGDSASAHGGRSHAVTSDERAVYDYDGVLQVPRSRRRVSGACRLAQYRHRAAPRHGHLARAVPTAGVPDPFF